jgi:hypothetical protein
MPQLVALIPETDVHLRLAPCPHCESRRRGLVESAGHLRGHCLRCGEILDSPLEVECLAAAVAVTPRRLLVAR